MLTTIDNNLNKEVTGFVVNSGFSPEGCKNIKRIQDVICSRFEESVWVPPAESLHVTLMDWFAPLVSYKESHEQMLEKYRDEYESILDRILKNQKPIKVHFNEIVATQSAVIIKGTDDGSFQEIRDNFLDNAELVVGTKLPPKIIHTSIVRFTEEIDLETLKNFINSFDINFNETVKEFRLVRERVIPMFKFDTLRHFNLD